jgi:hypothetical protein
MHFFTISKLLTKLELKHQDTYDETFFYTNYRISLSHSYHTEKSAVPMYI